MSIKLGIQGPLCFSSLWFYSPWDLGRFFGFSILYTAGRTPWNGDQSVERPLPTHKTTRTRNKRTQISMARVRFESTIPVFERAKTVHGIDRSAAVIDQHMLDETNCNACGSIALICVLTVLLFWQYFLHQNGNINDP
jgi:hypothetical protein